MNPTQIQREKKPWLSLLLALLAGTLTALSQPGYGLDWLSAFSLIPLFFALDNSSAKAAFFSSWLAGFVFFAILLYWLFFLSDWAGPWIALGYLVLCSYLALYWGVFGWLFSVLQKSVPGLHWLAVPALWVSLEFVRSLTHYGFTWGYLSDALYAQPELIQISSLTGAWGVSFLIALVNLLFVRALKHRQVRFVLAGLGVITLALLTGYFLMNSDATQTVRSLEIAIVHSHVNQLDRSSPSQTDRLVELYASQVEQSVQDPVDLIVLPETILPAFILRNPEVFSRFSSLAIAKRAWMIVGTIDYRLDHPGALYNTAALLSPQGQLVSTYDKVQLVPFSTDIGSFATPICFESIFSSISRYFIKAGSQAIITITNDGWFKDSLALPQHFAKGVFRAVETGRYFVQASNAGISGIVSDKGVILETTDAKTEKTLRGRIVLQDGWTFYTSYGDWFIVLLSLFL
ncbi:apolipoprotein N-acyltransferase, partial [Candidatus Acetothermia bacterium]|nr:apolipoprotein N-acyltransferase [Candidatus Acetothermia bacterium]